MTAAELWMEHGTDKPGRPKGNATNGSVFTLRALSKRFRINQASIVEARDLLAEAARERQKEGQQSGGRGRKKLDENVPSSSREGRTTRARVGKAVGMSGPTYHRAMVAARAQALYEHYERQAKERQREGGKKAGRSRPAQAEEPEPKVRADLRSPIRDEHKTSDDVARAVNVSPRTIEHARKVVTDAIPAPSTAQRIAQPTPPWAGGPGARGVNDGG